MRQPDPEPEPPDRGLANRLGHPTKPEPELEVDPTPEPEHEAEVDPTPESLDLGGEVEVWAAGGIVSRRLGGQEQILVVHRPRYDDWSLPKGKLDEGESLRDAALREVLEETGLVCRTGAPAGEARYIDARGRAKSALYFEMTVESGRFRPNDEVDEIRWLSPEAAANLLSYAHDVALISAWTAATNICAQ